MKEVFIIEKLDNHGEFQPTEHLKKSASEARSFLVGFAGENAKKFRVMPYRRVENRS